VLWLNNHPPKMELLQLLPPLPVMLLLLRRSLPVLIPALLLLTLLRFRLDPLGRFFLSIPLLYMMTHQWY
jgi:hypothetical protein